MAVLSRRLQPSRIACQPPAKQNSQYLLLAALLVNQLCLSLGKAIALRVGRRSPLPLRRLLSTFRVPLSTSLGMIRTWDLTLLISVCVHCPHYFFLRVARGTREWL